MVASAQTPGCDGIKASLSWTASSLLVVLGCLPSWEVTFPQAQSLIIQKALSLASVREVRERSQFLSGCHLMPSIPTVCLSGHYVWALLKECPPALSASSSSLGFLGLDLEHQVSCKEKKYVSFLSTPRFLILGLGARQQK